MVKSEGTGAGEVGEVVGEVSHEEDVAEAEDVATIEQEWKSIAILISLVSWIQHAKDTSS